MAVSAASLKISSGSALMTTALSTVPSVLTVNSTFTQPSMWRLVAIEGYSGGTLNRGITPELAAELVVGGCLLLGAGVLGCVWVVTAGADTAGVGKVTEWVLGFYL